MTTTTARKEIEGALKLIGVLDPAETMSPEDAADGLIVINDILDGWNGDRLMLYSTTTVVAIWSGATATIGVGGTVNTARPMEIEDAFFRIGTLDYHLKPCTLEQYNAIQIKTISTPYPEWLYYDGNFPLGNLFVWPVPSASTEYHISLRQQLTEFADLDTQYSLPQGYRKALKYTLAEEMAPLHSREPSPTVVRIAANARRRLRTSNEDVPLLTLDSAMRGDGSLINILSNR